MSVFAANKKYISQAMQYMYMAQGVQEEQQDIDFGRQLLTNIRQMRIQQAAMDVQSQGREGIMNTGFTAARQGMQTQFTQPYQQATEDYGRQEEIAELQAKANQALKKYKKQAKTARTAGYITSAVLAVAGGFIGAGLAAGAAAGTIGASIGVTGGAAIGGVAGGSLGMAGGSLAGADRNYMGGAVSGTIAGTSIAMAGTAFMGSGAAGGTVSEVASIETANSIGSVAEVVSTSGSWSASQWLAAGSIVSTIGGAIKDINGYEHKLPVSQGYTGQNYSQYVQSFRGFA